MKLSKSLLQAVMVGASLSGLASCSIIDNVVADPTEKNATTTEEEKGHCPSNPNDPGYDCPACGMG